MLSALALLTKSRPSKAQVKQDQRRAGSGPIIHEAQVTADAGLDQPPIGAMMEWGGPADPPGGKWLIADGRSLPQLDYPDLYLAYGETWNNGSENAGYFRIPDRRGRVGVGAGSGAGLTPRTLASKFGAETHPLTQAEMPVHDHQGDTDNVTWIHDHGDGTTSENTHFHTGDNYFSVTEAWMFHNTTDSPSATAPHSWSSLTGNTGSNAHDHNIDTESWTHDHGISSDGGDNPHNNVQPSVAVHIIVRALR